MFARLALAREMERTGFSAVICARRIKDRRIIKQRMELERRQAVRRAFDGWRARS